jgi:hypothetical protein
MTLLGTTAVWFIDQNRVCFSRGIDMRLDIWLQADERMGETTFDVLFNDI